MIGYRISLAELQARVEAYKPGWLARGAALTAAIVGRGRYMNEKKPIWSEIKPVYMQLQGESKCAYCERQLESVELGKGEQAVDHFRPKKRVMRWRVAAALKDEGVTVAPPPPRSRGYHKLAYHLFNYAAACAPCNSILKKDYFPVANGYDQSGDDPVLLAAEEPYLIYPLGDFDADPEALIEFYGVSPKPVAAAGHDRHRALVTIAFFQLDAVEKRKNLFRDRAMMLVALHAVLQAANGTGTAEERREAQGVVEAATAPNAAHTNCARSFKRLYERNPGDAATLARLVYRFLCSIS
ncbi:MAG TPA: hypothetical protein VFJ16_21065 [Longimicrobium sp.]|nr:hypothetical protein [Longimicrobium sp.]